jgi:acetyl-CoA carboxylase biotin carboxyl carrier protein
MAGAHDLPGSMNVDLKKLKALLKTLEDADVAEFEFEDKQSRLRIRLTAAEAAVAPLMIAASVAPGAPLMVGEPVGAGAAPVAGSAAALAADDANAVMVTSPFVGTFYRAPSPDAPPFVEEDSKIREGQTLCIVEAMKLMNEIEADCAGVIKEILVENGKSVEFGQPLFRVATS